MQIVSFSRTSAKCGERFVTSCSQHRISNLPWWGRVYWLFTGNKQFKKGWAYTYDFAKGPTLIDFCEARKHDNNQYGIELFKECRDLATALAKDKALQYMYLSMAEPAEEGDEGHGGAGEDGGEGEESADPAF